VFISTLVMLSLPAFAAPIEIKVTDSKVVELELDCGGTKRRVPVKSGLAVVPDLPGKCKVSMIRPSGMIEIAGKYTCSPDDCTLAQFDHKPTSDSPGRINIILAPSVVANGVELSCPSGTRLRATVDRRTAVFDGVPAEDCMMMFKGGPPLRYQPLSHGTYTCQISGSTVLCNKDS
jgi:hypothetical protein